MVEYTTIRVSREVHEAINNQGMRNEEYDEILRRILTKAGIDVKESVKDNTRKLF